jgi:hypothetical protein
MQILSGGCDPSSSGSGGSRRQFLKTGAMTLSGLALPELLRRPIQAAIRQPSNSAIQSLTGMARGNKSVLFVFLAGGPSQLDMYDMKPDAPAEIRGEFQPIHTNVPGVRVCEHLTLHAKIADKFAIVNGVQTTDSHDPSVIDASAKKSAGCQIDLLIPSVIQAHAETEAAPARLEFKSRQTHALPHGNWDTHGRVLGRQLSIFDELRDKLPAYDRLIYGLITDIYQRGLDRDVLLIVCGEFGRTPWINEHGGRNHWAPSGSVLFAGGGLKMGQVIGDTGPVGEREQSRSQPYTAGNMFAMIYRHLGSDPAALWCGAQPIAELI